MLRVEIHAADFSDSITEFLLYNGAMSPDAVLSSQVQVAVARSPALLPRQVVLLVLCLCMVLSGARAAEPWADPKLPSSDGLQLWLDGSRQVSFRQQHGPRWLSEGARVDRWFDGSGQGGVKAWIDGKAGGKRDRTPSTIFGGEILVGARFYSNNDELPHARGFFEGDIAEILVYDRALDDATRERVTAYLTEKYSALRAQSDGIANAFNPLVPVIQPPPAQMFVPGFRV